MRRITGTDSRPGFIQLKRFFRASRWNTHLNVLPQGLRVSDRRWRREGNCPSRGRVGRMDDVSPSRSLRHGLILTLVTEWRILSQVVTYGSQGRILLLKNVQVILAVSFKFGRLLRKCWGSRRQNSSLIRCDPGVLNPWIIIIEF
jgi:hypothetical protein